MVVYAGYTAVVKMSGTSTTFTGEATTLVSGTTYQITNTAKRIWNPGVALTVLDGVTPVVPTAIDYLFGKVTLPAPPGGAVTVAGAYYPTYELANGREWTANMTHDLIDTTPFKTTDPYRQRTHGLISASGDITLYNSGVIDIHGTDISAITFVGGAFNDMSAGGTFTGSQTTTFTVKIDLEGIPDTFRWSIDGGATWIATGVPITGVAQTLQNGITVTFATTSTHDLNDTWTFTVTSLSPNQVFIDGSDKLLEFRLGGSGKFLRVWAVLEAINRTSAIEDVTQTSFTWQSTSRGIGANFSIGS